MAAAKVVSVNDWTRGRSVGFIPYSWFHKDETALLNAPKETLFFQDFGLDPEVRAAYVASEPDEEWWFSKDYDQRWRWTLILRPRRVGPELNRPMDWETIEKLLTERKEKEPLLSQEV